MRPRSFAALGAMTTFLAASWVTAQDFESLFDQPLPKATPPRSPEQFGGGVEASLVPIQAFIPLSGLAPYSATVQGYVQATPSADVTFWAPLSVPVGASVEQVCLEVFDNDSVEAMTFLLVAGETGSAGNPAPAGVPLAGASTGTGNTPGYVTLCAAPIGTFTFPLSVRTRGNANGTGSDSTIQYYLLAAAPATTVPGAVMFGPAVVSWRRVVSPAPAIATFTDVPTTHIFFRFIEALSRAGITGGCGGGNYCPDNPVTRGEMATFIAAALGLHFAN